MNRRFAALLVAPVALVALAGCRGGSGGAPAPPPTQAPGANMQQQLDDVESTLDSIESELSDG